MHHTPLIGTIVAGLVMAFFMGALAHRLRMPPSSAIFWPA